MPASERSLIETRQYWYCDHQDIRGAGAWEGLWDMYCGVTYVGQTQYNSDWSAVRDFWACLDLADSALYGYGFTNLCWNYGTTVYGVAKLWLYRRSRSIPGSSRLWRIRLVATFQACFPCIYRGPTSHLVDYYNPQCT
jgi:hypothetical protein